MRKGSIKNVRINSEVLKELSQIIAYEVKDPRINPFTSVMDVYVAPDLKTCKVYISVMGSDEDKENTMTGLNSAKGMIRSLLAKRMNMRNTPELTFILDESIEKGIEMMKFIDEVNAPLHEKERLEESLNGEDTEDTEETE
ncbi:MAG: 30S ribosome-binding factor RbfA [Lachnospiraceae bacterium]|nr:30S ribosome-binding factor RbfA [Lachnospiraceae bacterium]MBR5917944.1 30S ribosome-binding factor RbfA [Lachnospiraceae bacterium]MBR6382844.1 30S ribosome-binding factor RbfA [Lachnospiraceae bacterium]